MRFWLREGIVLNNELCKSWSEVVNGWLIKTNHGLLKGASQLCSFNEIASKGSVSLSVTVIGMKDSHKFFLTLVLSSPPFLMLIFCSSSLTVLLYANVLFHVLV